MKKTFKTLTGVFGIIAGVAITAMLLTYITLKSSYSYVTAFESIAYMFATLSSLGLLISSCFVFKKNAKKATYISIIIFSIIALISAVATLVYDILYSDTIGLIFIAIMAILLSLPFIFVIIAMNAKETIRTKKAKVTPTKTVVQPVLSEEETKLQQLKTLLDKNLITQEEYKQYVLNLLSK